MAEFLERTVTMQKVMGSSPGGGGHKNYCGRRKPSDYVSFRRAVERQQFHTLNTHDTEPRTTQQ